MSIQDIRQARAEAAYQAYSFGSSVTVESANGWEYTTPGKEMTRKVFCYVDDEAPADESNDTKSANFTVVFESEASPVVVQAYALMSDNGEMLGSMPDKALDLLVNDKMADTAAEAMLYEVDVSYYGEGSKGHLKLWRGLARDNAHAEELAHEAIWDDRLTAASCSPVFATQQVPRFLVSEGWGHTFVGNTESLTRWVLDRLTEKLVHAEVAGTGLKSSVWYPLSEGNKDDLHESLVQANDILVDFDDFGVEALDMLPEWAVQNLESRADERASEQPSDSSSPKGAARSARRMKP